MSAEHDLLATFREWRRLAGAEREAICARNWKLLAAFQAAIANLSGRISYSVEAARAEWAESGCDCIAKEKAVETAVHELIVLGQKNQVLLGEMLKAAQVRLAQLNQVGQNLQRLKYSYGFAPLPAWSSFS